MRLDLAAGKEAFQAATGTGDNRVVKAEIKGPLVGPEIPSEADCKQLLADQARSAWCVNEDDDGAFQSVRVKYSGYQAVWVGKVLHEAEKLRDALKHGKATEEEVRTAWFSFALGDSAPGSGKAKLVVIDWQDLLEKVDNVVSVCNAVASGLEKSGAKIINRPVVEEEVTE